jgi:hypothetical protein
MTVWLNQYATVRNSKFLCLFLVQLEESSAPLHLTKLECIYSRYVSLPPRFLHLMLALGIFSFVPRSNSRSGSIIYLSRRILDWTTLDRDISWLLPFWQINCRVLRWNISVTTILLHLVYKILLTFGIGLYIFAIINPWSWHIPWFWPRIHATGH